MVSHLALPQGQHGGVARVPLLATVPAEVVVGAVPVALTVGVVPLAVVGHQVVEREAVVRHYEVDALVRMPAVQKS